MSFSRFSRILPAAALIVAALAIALIASHRDKLTRVYHVMRLFEPEQIVSNFRPMDTMFHTAPVRRGGTPRSSAWSRKATPQGICETRRPLCLASIRPATQDETGDHLHFVGRSGELDDLRKSCRARSLEVEAPI